MDQKEQELIAKFAQNEPVDSTRLLAYDRIEFGFNVNVSKARKNVLPIKVDKI
jgi:hypothetical protein